MKSYHFTDDASYGQDISKAEMASSIGTYNYLVDVHRRDRRISNMFKAFLFMIPIVYIVARIVVS